MTSNKYRNIFYLVAFVDLLLAMCTVFMALFVVAYIAMNPVTSNKGNIVSDAQFMVELAWPLQPDCDIDLWVKGPEDDTVYFSHREGKYGHLERDSMGTINNSLKDFNGNPLRIETYKEDWFLRSPIAGTYKANIHLYSCQTPTSTRMQPNNTITPALPVTLTVQKLNPHFELLFEKKVKMTVTWQETPVVSFEIDRDGKVLSIDENTTEKFVNKNIEATTQNVPSGQGSGGP